MEFLTNEKLTIVGAASKVSTLLILLISKKR